jgi:hypothetical protein
MHACSLRGQGLCLTSGIIRAGYDALRTNDLDLAKVAVQRKLVQLDADADLARTGCTIVSDRWEDVNHRSYLDEAPNP